MVFYQPKNFIKRSEILRAHFDYIALTNQLLKNIMLDQGKVSNLCSTQLNELATHLRAY